MNALKHMEFIFGAVVVLACAMAALPERAAPRSEAQALRGTMPVVVIKAKRMTELEKRASLGADADTRPPANGS